MSQQKWITVAADENQEGVEVGSVVEFRFRRMMADAHGGFRKFVERRSTTLQEMFGLPEKVPMRVARGV